MDSSHYAPEIASYVSNQSGSVPSSHSLEDSDKEFLTQMQTMGVMEVDNNKDTEVSVNGGGDSGSDTDGFVSGDEEFETAPERPILVYPNEKSTEGEFGHAPFVNSAEFFTPKAGRPIAKVSVDDDDDDEYAVEDSEGEISGGGDGNLNSAGEDTVEKFEIEAATSEAKEDVVQMESIDYPNFGEEVKESGFSDSHEEFVEASGGIDNKGSDSGKVEGSMQSVFGGEMIAQQNGVELDNLKDENVKEQNNELSYYTQQVEGSMQSVFEGEMIAGQNGVELDNLKNEEVVKEQNKLSYDTQQVEGSIQSVFEGEIIAEQNGVEFNNLKDEEAFKEHNNEPSYNTQQAIPTEADSGAQVVTRGNTPTGDSIVDTLQVNLLASGVAAVGDEEGIEYSEIKGTEAAASGVSLDNGFDSIKGDAEEPFDKFVASDAKSDHNDTKFAEKGLHIAPSEEGEKSDFESQSVGTVVKALQDDISVEAHADEGETDSHVRASGESRTSEYIVPNSSWSQAIGQDEDDEEKLHPGSREIDGSGSDGEGEDMIFGSSEAAQRFFEELEQRSGADSYSGAESSRDPSQRIDGQIVTDSDEEVDTDEEGDGKELFDSAALAALLKAATSAGQDGGNITISSQDGSRLFSVERPAGLGSSLQSVKPAARPNRVSLFNPSNLRTGADSDSNLSEEEKKKMEKVQQIRVKFLRLVKRLSFNPEESIAAQVLYRLTLVAGRQSGQLFSLDDAKRSASQLEAEGRDDLKFSLNILVIGKTGVGKSATINSIFGETKTGLGAYRPATTAVTEIVGMVDGVTLRIFDTPGLKSSAVEQNFNRKVLSMVKKFTKKSPPDIVLYVDRLDTQTRDLNDLPLLKSITNALGPSIWQNTIVTLTHAASAPPDGPSGSPLGYDVFVAQRSHIVQQTIGHAVGDLRLMNPSLMNPVSLVENHPSCRKNRDGEKVLPNGQSWRPNLLLLCYSMKILSEVNHLSKTQDTIDQRRLFGFHVRSPPLPYLLSWLLQSRTHPKLPADQGGDNGDSDIELADLSDSDLDDDEDEYDQLPPFKPLRKSQIAKLSKEQRKAYFEEYDYRVKLLQKKQWREELKRMRDMKKKGKAPVNDYNYPEEDDQENGSPAAVPVPLPDMALPPSFDSDNPVYRYRFLEPTSQLLTRPVLDTHGWDHDCGYDGVNLENTLAIINQFPAAVTVQITKDKKDFSIHLDSSIAAKLGENGSAMAGFDIQNVGKQLAYIFRGETKCKNFKRNKTAAGVSVTFLGENVSTGLKIEDQIALGKRLVLVGSTGTVRCQGDSAYGANIEVRLREADYPIGQDQSSLGLSLVKWRGDLALGANFQSQISIGRCYKMAVRAGLNNKLSGQITVRTSSSDQLQIALVAILPIARAIYKNFWPGASENYSIY